jgi:hypothetical protein
MPGSRYKPPSKHRRIVLMEKECVDSNMLWQMLWNPKGAKVQIRTTYRPD